MFYVLRHGRLTEEGLEHLAHYVIRAPISQERMIYIAASETPGGQRSYILEKTAEFKTIYRSGLAGKAGNTYPEQRRTTYTILRVLLK